MLGEEEEGFAEEEMQEVGVEGEEEGMEMRKGGGGIFVPTTPNRRTDGKGGNGGQGLRAWQSPARSPGGWRDDGPWAGGMRGGYEQPMQQRHANGGSQYR